jgi:hypothetical protein
MAQCRDLQREPRQGRRAILQEGHRYFNSGTGTGLISPSSPDSFTDSAILSSIEETNSSDSWLSGLSVADQTSSILFNTAILMGKSNHARSKLYRVH